MALKKRTAREIEREAAAAGLARGRPRPVPENEALAMLVRRGLKPQLRRLDLPFPPDLGPEAADRLTRRLSHYAFRLFLRGAIQRAAGFLPEEATSYLEPRQCRELADLLVDLGLAARAGRSYRLTHPASTFGDTLEWYVARELRSRLRFEAAAGVKFHAPGIGGDFDVVAAAEGKLVYLELKSSPPKHVSDEEVWAFLERAALVRADVTLFVMDTALRLSDKIVPMLVEELSRRRGDPPPAPRRIERELWAITPRLYTVNGRPDLVANIARAIADALRQLSPGL